jgi:hypothetical protein
LETAEQGLVFVVVAGSRREAFSILVPGQRSSRSNDVVGGLAPLLFTISDDSVGRTDVGGGSGLAGLADRIEELGGHITIITWRWHHVARRTARGYRVAATRRAGLPLGQDARSR